MREEERELRNIERGLFWFAVLMSLITASLILVVVWFLSQPTYGRALHVG